MGNLVDLHTHSTASDGTLSPAELVEHAHEKGIKAIALTDHDTVSGIKAALQKAEQINAFSTEAVEVVPGIEISCNYGSVEVHILGFFADYENAAFLEALEDIRKKRVERNQRMVALCNEHGMEITMQDLYHGNPATVVTRAHFARIMMEKGYVKSKAQAFEKYISPGRPLYLPKPVITPEKAMNMLNMAKAVPVLAHPYLYKMGDKKTEECIQYLKTLGLLGVEAYHSSNSAYDSAKLKEMAMRNGLVVTGGSDYHGGNKPDIEIGCGRGGLRVHESLLEEVRKCAVEKQGENLDRE